MQHDAHRAGLSPQVGAGAEGKRDGGKKKAKEGAEAGGCAEVSPPVPETLPVPPLLLPQTLL